MRSCVQTAPCVTIVRFYVSLGEPVEKRIAPLWICAFKTDSGWEVRISGVQRTGGQLRQSEDRCGSKCEELEVSTTSPLSLRNSPSKRTSPIGKDGPNPDIDQIPAGLAVSYLTARPCTT